MGVYQRGGMLWLDYLDGEGKRKQRSSGFRAGEQKKAEEALAIIERKMAAERELRGATEAQGVLKAKGLTLGAFARYWHKQRQKEKPQAAKEDRWKLDGYILPAFEHHQLADIRPRHARGFVLELKTKKTAEGRLVHAPRTVRSIWSCFRSLVHDAVADEFISQDPCILKRGDLPPVEDKDPDWRAGAVYERDEVEQLISDERIPLPRRVRNALLFLAGFRPSEAFALRWKHYTPTTEPLGRLDLMRAFNTAMRAEKGLKVAAKRRLVPVHPTLAKLLAEWKLSGWEAHTGQKPSPEALLIPDEKGAHTRVDDAYQEMLSDQEMLGWRKRRLYDSRRTFISLAQADGASKELLRWVTHGPKSGEVMDLYTSIPWVPICGEVAKLRINLRASGRIVELRRASRSDFRDSSCDTQAEGEEMLSHSEGRRGDSNPGPTDYKSAAGAEGRGRQRNVSNGSAGLPVSTPPDPTPPTRPPVTGAVTPPNRRIVAVKLQAALTAWMEGESLADFRARLLRLLALVPEVAK